jgi:methyltransferase (TIGR00027 family)
MKEGKPSRTAEIVAAWRAVEALKPENERVCHDPFAKDFLGPLYTTIGKFSWLRKIGLWYAERSAPGGVGTIVVRTRYIDEYLKTCIDDGIEQLVILGSGYDSRPYRFEELKDKARVFEVDYASTQAVKIKKVKKILGFVPDNVVYVAVDFDRERLDRRLFESGYDPELKTLFIWEGVTTYITAEAVDETLAFVANNSGKHSSLIFTYVFRSAVDGTCNLRGAKRWRKAIERRGEPPTFGIEEGAIEEFLCKRGFCNVKNVTMEALRKDYFKGMKQDRKVFSWAGIAHATVDHSKQT